MAEKCTPQMMKEKNIAIAKRDKIIKDQRIEKDKLFAKVQELEDKLAKINSRSKVDSAKILRIKEEIRKKNKETTKQITMRLKIETIDKLKLEEKMYQRLINKILDAWVSS